MKIRMVTTSALLIAVTTLAQEEPPKGQDRESMAMDSTATQWSFQFAHQWMSYHDDTLDNGQQRPQGLDNYFQIRVVAPVPLKHFTVLPRLTLRHYENLNTGQSGWGNSEIFGLIVPRKWDWGTGRIGVGPLVTTPGEPQVAKDEWGYGLAGAIVNTQGKWFYGVLLTQSWRSIDPDLQQNDNTTDINPLGIAPFLAYRIARGWYVQTADLVMQYDWDKSEFYMPIGARVGKVFVTDNGSWNLYGEYVTSLIYKDWSGTAVKDSFRINLSYTIPVGL